MTQLVVGPVTRITHDQGIVGLVKSSGQQPGKLLPILFIQCGPGRFEKVLLVGIIHCTTTKRTTNVVEIGVIIIIIIIIVAFVLAVVVVGFGSGSCDFLDGRITSRLCFLFVCSYRNGIIIVIDGSNTKGKSMDAWIVNTMSVHSKVPSNAMTSPTTTKLAPKNPTESD